MLRGSINHVSITVSNLDEAMKFFKPFLGFLDYEIGDVIRDPNGQRLTVNILPGVRGVAVNIWEAKPEFASHRFEVYEVGLHHLAFHVEKREEVDQVHELVKQLGAKILNGPGEFPYGGPSGWYAVYFLGPDHLKFEVVHMPSAERAFNDVMRTLERGARST